MLPALKTVLYATDLGRHAPRVLRYALSLARSYGGSVVVLHVVETLGPAAQQMVGLYAGPVAAGTIEKRAWPELERTLRERLEALCAAEGCADAAGGALVADIRVRLGRPDEVILKEAGLATADVIVMGSHGHSTVGEIVLGSTAHRVSQHATVPVLLIRTAESDTGTGC